MPFILNSIVFRVFTLFIHFEPIPLLQLLRGFLSDFIQCLPFIFLYGTFKNKFSHGVILVSFSLLIAANTEHIIVNNGHISYRSILFITDKQFLTGSALSSRAILLFISACILFVLFQLTSAHIKSAFTRLPSQIHIRKPLQLLITVAVTYMIPISIFNPNWIQQSFLEQNISSLIFADQQLSKPYVNSSSYNHIKDRSTENSDYHLLNPYEIKEGTSLLNHLSPEKNILFILIEGLSQHQVMDDTLKNIKKLGEENFSAGHFIASQRQTHNGLYALFCGKFPNLISRIAKSDIVSILGPDTLCLPEILKQNGFETVFLQSADLSFMRKDQFTRNIGFMQSIGNPTWVSPRLKTDWGIDDLTLYDNALVKIQELNKQNKKWFMSLLTVSTHHPYQIPGAAAPGFPFNLPGVPAVYPYKEALVFADDAVNSFIKKLKVNHVLDDTLVIIMSDEANGTGTMRLGNSETSNFNFLSNNHGPFVAIGKRIPKSTHQDQVFSQVDIPATTLDYMNIDTPKPVGGRSIFRTYNSEKKVFFGNVFSDIFGYFEGARKVVLCTLNLSCSKFNLNHDALSGNNFQFSMQSSIEEKELEFIKKIIDVNDIFSSSFKDWSLLIEKNKICQGKFNYELVRGFNITSDSGKPVKIEFNIDNTQSSKSNELIIEIKIENFKSQGRYASKTIIHPGELKSFVKDIQLTQNEEYSLDIYAKAMNTEKWNVDSIQIHYY